MKKSISLIVLVSLLMTQFSFATNANGDDDYLIKSMIVKGEITAEEAYSEQDKVQAYSLDRGISVDKSLDQYYIFNTTKIEKYGVEFEEIWYKKKLNNLNSSLELNRINSNLRSMNPEEGDFKLVINKGSLSGYSWTNGCVDSYGLYIKTNGVFKLANIIGSLTLENPVICIANGEILNYLQNNLKGKGNTFTKKGKFKSGDKYIEMVIGLIIIMEHKMN